MKVFRFLALFCLVLAFSTIAVAAEKGGVTMPNTKTVAGKNLVLNGMGLREATVFNVDVYAAGLYLESKSKDGKAIAASNQTKQLVLHFVRDVDRSDIVGAWNEGFKKNTNNLGALQSKIN
ncbi:MAG: chalcone isomerase family protein, partial [Myxococcota bacterium]